MDVENETTGLPGTNYPIHSQLNQECRVVLEELPVPHSEVVQTNKLVTNLTKRRQSVRLQGRVIPMMREAPGPTMKKRMKKHPEVVTKLANGSPDTANVANAQFSELSDNYIVELLNEMTSFITNGVWGDSTSETSDFDLLCATSDLPSVPTSEPSTVLLDSTIDKSANVFVPDNVWVADGPRSITTQTDSRDRLSISTQTECTSSTKTNQRSIATQTSFRAEKSVTSSININQSKTGNATYVDANISSEPKISKITQSKIADFPFGPSTLHSNQYQMKSSKLLTPRSNFDLMKKEVQKLLRSPCRRYLANENCSSYCQKSHYLPSANVVAETIKNWSNELILFFYVTSIQRYMMCHLMYFETICSVLAERQLPDEILATVKDCEQMCLEKHLLIVWMSLRMCGYSADDGLFEICVHAYRSPNTLNEILKIICAGSVVNFKRTIAFLATEIDTNDFDPFLGNEILKQACVIKTMDVALLELCCGIIRKYSDFLNEDFMRMLLSKI